MQNYIVCLKYGNKYGPEYVNNLYEMAKRHCSLEYKFVCITEEPVDLISDIVVLPLRLEDGISGWWYKTYFFDPEFLIKGRLLFLDLDIVIFDNIDKFFEYEQGSFCISRGFSKGNYDGINSSCFRLDTGTQAYVYTEFMANKEKIIDRLHGDQDWIQENVMDYKFWPDGWLKSYKWGTFTTDTAIAVFHGFPKPHELYTPWIQEHWR